MIGAAQALALDVPLPDGVALRRVTTEDDVRAMSALQDEVFDDPVSDERAEAVLNRLAQDDGMELWVAEAAGPTVSAGRLEPVPGSAFAGIWGGGHAHGVARSRHLPRADGRPSQVGTPAGFDARAQRLDRVLPPDP